MAAEDALQHFMTSTDDPYTLLELPNGPASTEKEIRSAWKKTALKFHPDKIKDNVDEATANRIYILRQDAYGILSEPHLREQYDNALRAKEHKRMRDAAITGKRKGFADDLRRREDEVKRQKTSMQEQDAEAERIKQDNQRKLAQFREKRRREAEEERVKQQERDDGSNLQAQTAQRNGSAQLEVQDMDRVVKLRFPKDESTAHLSVERVQELFSRFGAVERVTLREKKIKVEGEKHRKVFMTVAVFFKRVAGAYAAVSEFGEVAEQGDWRFFDQAPAWASGEEPLCISRPTATVKGADDFEVLDVRVRIAEKKRREDKRRREEAAAAVTEAEGDGAMESEPSERTAPTFASFPTRAAAMQGSGEDAAERDRKREAERERLMEEMRRADEEEDAREAAAAA